ncbi:phage recombination protein Bet [Methylocystis echinoides]|uniref:Phage recombination protein Bet n=1 Tax=Methylocystis echinoides TaxID=29468 RepID=A0A9W6LTR7_9HYPH|nr:phage recombination protein Bet [Methylocystis echinoides]GLI94674.1 phage recombination protein Bet [Methylocystis echinoides]
MRPIQPRNELVPITSLPTLYNPRDLALIRRTVAADTTDDEFALFIHWARSLRLDPLRRQTHAFVFSKSDPKRRRLSLVTSIEGYRAIAARTGNYRPDEQEPTFITDETLKSELNPAGLISCSIRVWQHSHGQWFQITGTARWDEFAPIRTVRVDNQPTDRKVLDKSGKWADMPFLMLAKCAEAQALRKGWPEDLANTFVGEEVDQAAPNLHPAEAAAEGATRERLERIGGREGIIVDWLDETPLEPVPIGRLADRIIAYIRDRRRDNRTIIAWRERNRHALREFWARAPADALGVKQAIEQALTHEPSDPK